MQTRPLGKAPAPRPINPVLSRSTLVRRGFCHQPRGGTKELVYSIARGPPCHLHATAKPLCRVQIPDITVRVSGSEVARMLPCNRRYTDSCPLYALVMSHARTTSRSLLQYGAISQSAQTREWLKNREEQLRAISSYQAPPRRRGDPRHLSTHYTVRIPVIV